MIKVSRISNFGLSYNTFLFRNQQENTIKENSKQILIEKYYLFVQYWFLEHRDTQKVIERLLNECVFASSELAIIVSIQTNCRYQEISMNAYVYIRAFICSSICDDRSVTMETAWIRKHLPNIVILQYIMINFSRIWNLGLSYNTILFRNQQAKQKNNEKWAGLTWKVLFAGSILIFRAPRHSKGHKAPATRKCDYNKCWPSNQLSLSRHTHKCLRIYTFLHIKQYLWRRKCYHGNSWLKKHLQNNIK